MRRRPSSGGEAPVDVVLGDEDAAGTATDAPVDVPATDGAPRRLGRRPLWVAALLGAVVALAVGNAVVAQRDAARLAALEHVAGIGARLDEPWVETWRTEGRLAGDLGDRVLIGEDLRDGAARAVDVATGRTVWTREAPDGASGETCRVADVDVGPPTSVAVCTSSLAEGSAEEADSGSVVAVVDVGTGETLARRRVDRAVIDHGVAEGDVVVLATRADGHLAALRWDVDADEILWRTTSAVEVSEGSDGWSTTWSARVLTVQTSRFALDLRSGREIPPQYVNDLRWLDVRRHELPGGRAVEWPNALESEVAATTARVLGPDGTLERTVEGRPVVPAVDDGSADGVLLTTSGAGTLQAFELATGDRAWRTRVPADVRPEFLVSRVLLVTAGSSAAAFDVRTGEHRWTQPMTEGFRPVTDGSYVLLEHAVDGRSTLAAHRLDDGTAAWTQGLPVGADQVVTLSGGGTVAVGDGLVLGLG